MFFQRAWVAFSRISSFVFCRWNKVIQVWNDMRVSKQWQNLHFCINCHVNFRMQLIFLKWRHVLHTLYHSHFHPRQLWCYQVHHYQVNDLTNCNKKQWCLPSMRKMGLIRERCRQSSRLVGPGERKRRDFWSSVHSQSERFLHWSTALSATSWYMEPVPVRCKQLVTTTHTSIWAHKHTHTLFCALIHSYARSRQHGHTRSDRTPSCTNKCSIMMLNPLSLLFDESALKEQAAMMWSNNPVPLFALRASR